MKPIRHLSLSEIKRVFKDLTDKVEELEKKVDELEKPKKKTKTKKEEVK